MGRNMLVRLGVDASDFQKKMNQAGASAESTGKRIRKGLSMTNLSSEVGKIMGWSGASTGVGSITAQNLGIAQDQLGSLRSYRDQLASLGFDDYQFGAVSERIKELEYDIDAYIQSLKQADDATAETADEVSNMGEASDDAASSVSKIDKKLRDTDRSGRRLNVIPSFIRQIGNSSGSSTNKLERMVRSIRNISVVSFGLRIAKGIFGEFSTLIKNQISQDAQLQAQVNGLSAALSQTMAPAINLVVNALSYVLPYVVGVSNAISSLMGALLGSGWSAAAAGANKTAAATGGAAKAQKEMNKQLLSFDQINRMEGQQDSGGGGGGAGKIATPIEAKSPTWLEDLKATYTNLFESAEFQAANFGGKIGMVLNTSIEEVFNLASGIDFTKVGTTLAENFNSAVGAIDWSTAGSTIGIGLTALPLTLLSFIQAADWPLVGSSVSQFLIGALGSVSGAISSVDWIKLGNSVTTFITNVDWAGVTQSVSTLLGTALGAAAAFLWGLIEEPWNNFVDTWLENTEEVGGDIIGGLLLSLAEGLVDIGTWLWENFCKPIIDGVKEGFGIHSPSKVFGEIGENCSSSLTDRFGEGLSKFLEKLTDLKTKVTDAASRLKEAFSFEWKLPHLRLPHLSVNWDPVDNVLANFFGVNAFPRLNVDWYAKGFITNGTSIFNGIGIGERGREALLPLDSNDGWKDEIAHRIAMILQGSDGGDVNATINLNLDGNLLTSYVIKEIRRKSRAGTVSI